jgi:hypothetical protein
VETVQILFIVVNAAVWLLLLVGGLRVVWFAWVGPRRLDDIERKIDALTSAVATMDVRLERHIDQR